MTDRATLLALAERVEKAEGPDKEIDFLIWAALNGIVEIVDPAEGHPMTPGKSGRVEGRDTDGNWHLLGWVDPGQVQRNWSPYGGPDRYPKVTASIDAAMTLVPEGWSVKLIAHPDEAHAEVYRLGDVIETASGLMRPFAPGGTPIEAGPTATPALALIAAALRARAASEGEGGK